MAAAECHRPGCVCERCFSNVTRAATLAAERPLPASRAEYQANLDRAFNAGVRAGRERGQRERSSR